MRYRYKIWRVSQTVLNTANTPLYFLRTLLPRYELMVEREHKGEVAILYTAYMQYYCIHMIAFNVGVSSILYLILKLIIIHISISYDYKIIWFVWHEECYYVLSVN